MVVLSGLLAGMLDLPENAGAIKKNLRIALTHWMNAEFAYGARLKLDLIIYAWGGVMAVHEATYVSRPRIYLGIKEIKSEVKLEKNVSAKAESPQSKQAHCLHRPALRDFSLP